MTTDENFLDDHTFLGDGHPDTLDQRLAREVPDHEAEEVPYERQPDAVGELVAVPEDEDEPEEDEEDEDSAGRDDDSGEFVFDAEYDED